jgi:hypothetical protein
MTDYGPYVRIAMRYGSGILVAYGLMTPETAEIFAVDPDIAFVLGSLIGAGSEMWYVFAKRQGGAT